MRKRCLLLILVGLLGSSSLAPNAFAQNVTFTDDNLAAAVRAALGLATGADIPQARLATLQSLTVPPNSGVADLTGIKEAANLRRLVLAHQALTSIAPIQGHLPELTYLDLSHNQLDDGVWDVLRSLGKLEEVRLAHNQLTRLNVDRWRNIKRIDASHNSMTRVRYLGSTVFDRLNLSHNKLTGDNLASDFFKIVTIARDLDVSHNKITNFRRLQPLNSDLLKTIDLSGNKIQDLRFLPVFKSLRYLYIYDNPITDFSPFERLTKLECLGFTWFAAAADIPFATWFPKIDSSFGGRTPRIGNRVTICVPGLLPPLEFSAEPDAAPKVKPRRVVIQRCGLGWAPHSQFQHAPIIPKVMIYALEFEYNPARNAGYTCTVIEIRTGDDSIETGHNQKR